MKKIMLLLALFAGTCMVFAETAPSKVTKTASAGKTSVSLTNANSVVSYRVLDVFVDLSSATTADSSIILETSTFTNSVFVDSAVISSNATGCVVDLANIELPQMIGDISTITRPATATSGVMTVTFVVEDYN